MLTKSSVMRLIQDQFEVLLELLLFSRPSWVALALKNFTYSCYKLFRNDLET